MSGDAISRDGARLSPFAVACAAHAVARAYEFSTYVGISDWSSHCAFEGLHAAGVAGIADPRPEGRDFFRKNGSTPWRRFVLDFERLDAFRDNRLQRGFAAAR